MKNIFVLIDNKLRKVFAQDFLSPDKLLRRILLYVPQLVFPSQGFVFMNTECMVRQQFHPLNLPEILKMLSQFVQILFRIAQSGHKHVAQPERVPAGLKPFGGMERLLIAPACATWCSFRDARSVAFIAPTPTLSMPWVKARRLRPTIFMSRPFL